MRDALQFLVEKDYLGRHERDGDTVLTVTELGRLTAQLMVSTYTGARLRQVFGMLPLPDDADMAEEALTCVLSVTVPELLDAPVAEANRSAVATAIRARGRSSRLTDTTAVQGLGSSASVQRGDLAWAALLLVARSPRLFAGHGRDRRAVAGIPMGTLYPVLEQSPRYLAWLAAQGYLGTVHPWVAIVSADLDRRVRWRGCTPGRGAGRLLWMCEQMATRAQAKELVPSMWRSALSRGVRAPDWAPGRPPADCELDQAAYTALLRERTTSAVLTARGNGAVISGIAGAVAWTGRTRTPVTITRNTTEIDYPVIGDGDPDAGAASGAAVFTRRGDHRATGWLAEYGQISPVVDSDDKPEAQSTRRGLGRATP